MNFFYKDLISEKDYKKNLNDLKTKIDEFKNVVIKQIIQLMENIYDNLQIYYNISCNLIYNYDKKIKIIKF